MTTEIKWVKESAFGIWFLNTDTWINYVLKSALADMQRMLPYLPKKPSILDIGCGRGKAFRLLEQYFNPERIVGIEVDKSLLADAEKEKLRCRCRVELYSGFAETLDLPDHSVDMVFCHQTFHHIVHQKRAIKEFYRVLKPGGVLLFAESCRRFIHSWSIRLLFRHPMDVQKTADEYLELIRLSGFNITPAGISKPFLWWSRWDLGVLEQLGFPAPVEREETMINVVATRP